MKKYDFETVVYRHNCGSYKWDEMKSIDDLPDKTIPFSLADMELLNPPEIIEGLKNFLDNSVLGYASATPAYKESIRNWMLKRNGWEIDTNWLKDSHGVINAFFIAVKAFTEEGDGVMLMTPVYYPMYYAIQRNNRTLVDNKLIRKGDRYEIDFEDFERKARKPETKLLILCSPHNPTSRVWTKNELLKIGQICLENQVLVVSDEIHSDLIMPGFKHTVFASLSEEFAMNSITCTAPSKTFNLAGLQTSNLIIPNEQIRKRYWEEVCTTEGNPKCNILGMEACRLAYNHCESWLEQLIELIEKNYLIIKNFMAEEFPEVTVFPLEGTYLLWMDFNGLGIECHELADILKKQAYLFLDEGFIFGPQGEGFERWNLACPTKHINAALDRLRTALNNYGVKRQEQSVC